MNKKDEDMIISDHEDSSIVPVIVYGFVIMTICCIVLFGIVIYLLIR